MPRPCAIFFPLTCQLSSGFSAKALYYSCSAAATWDTSFPTSSITTNEAIINC
ncbi:MAG: hypothetical protein SGI73_01910 [Chloroflexota bacterium]|nr:hypothetical protein [Chloroflexota bacterium]